MSDTPLTDTLVPTKRSSRRRPSPEPALAVPEPGIEPNTLAPAAAATEASPPPVPPPTDSAAAAPTPPMPPSVILREPGMAAPAAQQAAPITGEPFLPNSIFRKHDVVQVLDTSSRHYGQFLMVGDVSNRKVHGYYLTQGMHKEFVTIDIQHCWYIGPAKIRSAQPCSAKWISDNSRA